MKVECEILNSRLVLTYDDVKAIYIKGSYDNSCFDVDYMDFWGREDMSNEEKEAGMKSIEKFNSRNNNITIQIIDN